MNSALALTLLSLLLLAPALRAQDAAPAPTAEEKAAEEKAGAHYTKQLLGTWKFELRQEGMSATGSTTYKADGTSESKGQFDMGGQKSEFSAEAKWSVKGNKLSFQVTKTSDANSMPVGLKWTQTIVRINEKEFRYLDDEGKERVETRVVEEKKEPAKDEEAKKAEPAEQK
jgi:hypothetical protein